MYIFNYLLVFYSYTYLCIVQINMSLVLSFLISGKNYVKQYISNKNKGSLFKISSYHINKIRNTDKASPVTPVILFNRLMYIKRDDLIANDDIININNKIKLTGNKIRKFNYLLNPSNILNSKNTIISYGGIQSNSMLALAKICMYQNRIFYYFTNSVPNHIKLNPIGNFKLAISYGMKFIELDYSDYKELVSLDADSKINDLMSLLPLSQNYNILSNTLSSNDNNNNDSNNIINNSSTIFNHDNNQNNNITFIPQGGALMYAKDGLYQLAIELEKFIVNSKIEGPWKIYFASGTGTTAYYVNQYFKLYSKLLKYQIIVEIIAIPCIGDEKYLLEQMIKLDHNSNIYPTILETSHLSKRIFGGLYQLHYDLWKSLYKQTNIEFDLLYVPRAWEILLSNNNISTYYYNNTIKNDSLLNSSLTNYEIEYNIIFYHCGGIEGNPTQINRYRYKEFQ